MECCIRGAIPVLFPFRPQNGSMLIFQNPSISVLVWSLWEVFIALFGDREDSNEDDDEDRFIPSPLDLSVRVGHGGNKDEGVRELSRIRENARTLEEGQLGNEDEI